MLYTVSICEGPGVSLHMATAESHSKVVQKIVYVSQRLVVENSMESARADSERRVGCPTSGSRAMQQVGTDPWWPRAYFKYWAYQPSSFLSFGCTPSNSPASATTGSGSVQKGNSSSNIITGFRNVVWPPEVVNSSSGRTFRAGGLFADPQGSGTDRTGAAADAT